MTYDGISRWRWAAERAAFLAILVTGLIMIRIGQLDGELLEAVACLAGAYGAWRGTAPQRDGGGSAGGDAGGSD